MNTDFKMPINQSDQEILNDEDDYDYEGDNFDPEDKLDSDEDDYEIWDGSYSSLFTY